MAKRKAKRKPQRRFYSLVLGGLITLLAAALILIVTSGNVIPAFGKTVKTGNEDPLSGAVFAESVTVDGFAVGGMTLEEGRAAVVEELSKRISSIEFTLEDGEVSRTIKASDLKITTNEEEALRNALAYAAPSPTPKPSQDTLDLSAPDKAGQDFAVALSVDRASLLNYIHNLSGDFNKEPAEPGVKARLDDNNKAKFSFTEGENGRELNEEAAADALLAMLDMGQYQGGIKPEYTVIEPKTDVDKLKANTKLRSEFQTRFKYSGSDEILQNRCFNVQMGADKLNEAVIMVGEEFSFNGHVGLRTVKDGWKLANGISGGKEYTLQAGGGICQVSTTLYNALLCGRIKITDRRQHSIPSDYVPKGLDATVDSSGIDLKFMNDTAAPLYIFAYITKDKESSRYRYMNVKIYGEPLPDGVTYKTRSEIIENTPRDEPIYTDDPNLPVGYQMIKVIKHDGFVAEAYVDKYQNGKLIESVSLGRSTYKGNNAEILVGTGDPAKVAPPEGATSVEEALPAQPGDEAQNPPEQTQPPAQEQAPPPQEQPAT